MTSSFALLGESISADRQIILANITTTFRASDRWGISSWGRRNVRFLISRQERVWFYDIA